MGDKGDDHANIVVSSRVASERGAESRRALWNRSVSSQGQSTKILVNSSSSVAAPLVSFPRSHWVHWLTGSQGPPELLPSRSMHEHADPLL